ncbi:hypothetical protein BAY61_22840 [Prauserella marina]|uniref:Uncharacterized protein n=1 Tax=Prauserella marina TaxID=530584 RepID=A0A222VTU5_9PSEU|nr:DUF5753 domain-containing protein [Prauserella marina]ASR37365.1 hypothetical protein BAY61_22840 [Prauserella marina]PWV74770.1 hypothetical protein DES30_107168 [Prauserella marina]SDD41141.1 hypothetical protein SAMN05421630_10883 [Prauserella marina]
MVAPTPAVTADWFAGRMSTLRKASGVTPDQLAGALDRSASGVRQFESSTRLANKRYIRVALEQLGQHHLIEPYTRVVESAKAKPLWWKDIIPKVKKSQRPSELHALELLVNYEASATALHVYAPHCVPDLLQTTAYTDALCALSEPLLASLHHDLQQGRQAILRQDDSPRLHVLLGQSVLHRTIGSPKVMREQLAAMTEWESLPHVTIRVLPTAADAGASVESNFSLMDMAPDLDDDPGAVFVKTPADWIHFRDAAKIAGFRSRWELLETRALDAETSASLIGEAALALSEHQANH